MEDDKDISDLRIKPKAWEQTGVWNKLWGSAKAAADRRLAVVAPWHAEDIAIQCITNVIKQLPNRPDILTFAHLRRFTTMVANRLAISYWKKVMGPEGCGGKDVPLDEIEEKELLFSADYLQLKEQQILINAILNKLKPSSRQLLYDFHLNGMKHKEIAAKYNMPIHNIGTYIQRALKEIRECLQDDTKLLAEMRLLIGFNIWLLFLFWS